MQYRSRRLTNANGVRHILVIIFIQLVGIWTARSQGNLVIEPSKLFFTNAGPNTFLLINQGENLATIDSMHFSPFLPHGWIAQIESENERTDVEFAFGELAFPASFPVFSISPSDTAWFNLLVWDHCLVCGGTKAATDYDDTLSVVTGGTPPEIVSAVVDFSVYVGVQTQPSKGELSVAIYPNPARSVTTVGIDNVQGEGRVEIFDVLGRLVRLRVVHGQARIRETLDLTTMATGGYLIRVSDRSGVVVKTLVVLR